jgi:tripartite-type tricarboxylate transporter receptor subunit TctC
MLVATLAIAGQAAPAAAAGYPDKPVKIIFPNAAGSANELSILAITAKLKGVVPVPIAVVAMPGAGTAAGTRFVASQPADGYTMLFIHEAPLQTSALGMLGFDFLDKFEPLVRVNSAFPADYARADAPFSNMKELQAYAKAHPDTVRAGINTGALSHFEFLSIENLLGIKLRLVSIQGGDAGFRQAILAGDIDLMDTDPHTAAGMASAGQIKALTYYGDQRHADLPNTPTFAEQGFETPDVLGNHGYLWIRKDAPEEAKQYWRDVLKKLLTDPAAKADLDKQLGIDIGYLAGSELQKLVEQQYAHRLALIKQFGVKATP